MQNEPLILERKFSASPAKIWKALTDSEEMKEWYFAIPEFVPETGCTFQFLAGPEGKQYLHLCKVVEVIPFKKISYTWRYDGYAGDSLVSFELFEESGHTLLRITHSGLDSFPADNPDFVRTNFQGGWTYFLEKGLEQYLNPAA